jgi:dienelactone hydrolase
VGHSMGGFAALVAGAEIPQVDCVVSLAGANLGLWQAASPEGARRTAETLESWGRGPIAGIRGDLLVAEIRENSERFDSTRHADVLAEKRVLLVAATRDEVLPRDQHHDPLVAALQAQDARHLREQVLDADHAFSDQRIGLARAVVDFLDTECAGGPAGGDAPDS